MIRSFRHKGLSRLFLGDDPGGVRADLVARCLRRLDALDRAVRVDDLRLPGFNLHEQKGNRRGVWSIHVNGPFCTPSVSATAMPSRWIWKIITERC